tara:strand:- start:36 stop:347 length:312 start_codon:yes stop_codon:yes gene_type:complete
MKKKFDEMIEMQKQSMMMKNEKGEIIPTERQEMDYETKRVLNKEIQEEAVINSSRKKFVHYSAQQKKSSSRKFETNMVNFDISFIQNQEESKHSSMQNDIGVS